MLATPDVAATSAVIADDWGVALRPGGAHVGLGTRNELTGLGGSAYLEVVGPDAVQPAPPFPRPFGVDGLAAASLVAWCARPTKPLEDVIAACAARGIEIGEAMSMSRARPDGVLLEWRLTMPLLGAPHVGTVPFLIDWLASPHPAASLPHECELTSLQLQHPQADLVRAVLAEIGIDARIEVADGPAAIAAIITTPAGVRRL